MRLYFLLVEPDRARVPLTSCRHSQRRVQLGPARGDPSPAGALIEERSVEFGNDHVVAGLPGFHQHAAIRVEDHRVACADLVIVDTYPVTEYQKQPVVMRA